MRRSGPAMPPATIAPASQRPEKARQRRRSRPREHQRSGHEAGHAKRNAAVEVLALAILGACIAWGIDNNLTRNSSLADPLQIVEL